MYMNERNQETVNEVVGTLESIITQEQTLYSLTKVFGYALETLTGYVGMNSGSYDERTGLSMASNISSAFEILEFLQDTINEQTENIYKELQEYQR